jgi:hypothetical protein
MRRFSQQIERHGFGSFHSDDVEVLVRQSSSQYIRPIVFGEIEEDLFRFQKRNQTKLKFGHGIKNKLFSIRSEWCFLNHGAFGGSITPLINESNRWKLKCETQPLLFFDRLLLPSITYCIRQMSNYLNCESTDLLPLPNVTSGLNSIFNSLSLQSNDQIICLSLTYGATKKMLKHLAARTGANLNIINVSLPIRSKEIFLETFEFNINNSNTKLVVIDQITSNTGLNLPVVEMCRISKRYGCLIIVDAAHSLLSQDSTIFQQVIQYCDAWLSNGHKWLCMTKGCAYMWISSKMKSSIRPAIISHGYVPDEIFTKDRECRDYSSILTTSSALLFWSKIFPTLLESHSR